MRVLGLDYGSKTVGVAITDGAGITVQPLETIKRKEENKLRKTYARLEEIVREYEVGEIVVGLPYNMDGSIGERGLLCQEFAANVARRCQVEVNMWDERLTTVEADETLSFTGVKKEDRKTYIDQIAAVFILRDYLENKK